MFSAELPDYWSEHIDEGTSRVYFFNELTGDALWMHPQEGVFKELIEEVRCWRPNQKLNEIFQRADAHLRQAYSRAIEATAQWSGPYSAPAQGPEETGADEGAQFFYNANTGESRWSDPRQSVEFDLRQRRSIL